MQASTGSFTLIGGLIGFGAFLFWRGTRRAAGSPSAAYWEDRRRVPATEETRGDPVGDSGVAEATTSGTAGGQRTDAPRV